MLLIWGKGREGSQKWVCCGPVASYEKNLIKLPLPWEPEVVQYGYKYKRLLLTAPCRDNQVNPKSEPTVLICLQWSWKCSVKRMDGQFTWNSTAKREYRKKRETDQFIPELYLTYKGPQWPGLCRCTSCWNISSAPWMSVSKIQPLAILLCMYHSLK